MKVKLMLVAIITTLFTGCYSNEIMKPDERITGNNGVIVASVTQSGPAADTWFYYKKAGTNDEKRMDALGLAISKVPDDFPNNRNNKGRLLAFQVPAGMYDLTRWEIYIYSSVGGAGYISPKRIQPLPFIVQSGQVTYLGNLHADTLTGKNIFGIPVPAGGVATITNNMHQDLSLFKKKYPNLANLPVNVSVPNVSQWGLK